MTNSGEFEMLLSDWVLILLTFNRLACSSLSFSKWERSSSFCFKQSLTWNFQLRGRFLLQKGYVTYLCRKWPRRSRAHLVFPLHCNSYSFLIRSRQGWVLLKQFFYFWWLRINLSNTVKLSYRTWIIQKESKTASSTSINSFWRLPSSLSTIKAISCNWFSSFSLSCCHNENWVSS